MKPVLTRNRKTAKAVEPEHLPREGNTTLDRRGLRDRVRNNYRRNLDVRQVRVRTGRGATHERPAMTETSDTSQPHSQHNLRLNAVLSRAGRVALRMLAAVALIAGSAAVIGIADSTTAFAADGTCDGVTVVVDFTDVGGELEVGCAEGEPATGRDALLGAGFTATDSQPGFLCAINSMPNPCPETFDGNFWAYWNSTADSEWASYQVGADSSQPAPGSIEGWRYNDGATPPGIAPADVAAALNSSAPDTAESPEAAPGTDEAVTTSTLDDQKSDQTTVLAVVTVGFLALVVMVILFFVVRRRRGTPETR